MTNPPLVVGFPRAWRAAFDEGTNRTVLRVRRAARRKRRREAWHDVADPDPNVEVPTLDTPPDPVETCGREVVEMAAVGERHGHDPRAVLCALERPADEYGVRAGRDVLTDVEGEALPEEGLPLTVEDARTVLSVARAVPPAAPTDASASPFSRQPYERLAALGDLLAASLDHGVPPVVAPRRCGRP